MHAASAAAAAAACMHACVAAFVVKMVYLVSRREHHCLTDLGFSGTRAITAVA
jgi:hypothetical protein